MTNDDTVRFTKMPHRARGVPPLEAGPNKDVTPPFDELARDYYLAMGWDPNSGKPMSHTLDRLGLTEVKEAFAKLSV